MPDTSATLPILPAPPRPHILVVEDYALVRHVVARALRSAGFLVFEATDAEAARRMLGEIHLDLAVIDISLPGALNGVQLGHWIRMRSPDVPLIFMSGLTEWEMPEPIPAGPGIRFLAKPFGARVIADHATSLLAPRLGFGAVLPEA